MGYYDISMTKQTGDDGEKIPVTQAVAKLILKAGSTRTRVVWQTVRQENIRCLFLMAAIYQELSNCS